MAVLLVMSLRSLSLSVMYFASLAALTVLVVLLFVFDVCAIVVRSVRCLFALC